jgi:Icc-related predicted phosphoesterase
VKIAAIADLHTRANAGEVVRECIQDVQGKADALVIGGDLTDTGLPAEAETLAQELRQLDMPILAVLGNHDHESDKAEEISNIMREIGVTMLDGTAYEIGKVGFIGTKGFCGGFDGTMVQPFGERALKTFINTSIEETIRLENALAKLDCKHKVAVLHYSPVKDTLVGEPPELWAFLGTSRLANALERREVDVIVHGHAHHGSPQGRTPGKNIPVHNVSRFVQKNSTGMSYCILEVGN